MIYSLILINNYLIFFNFYKFSKNTFKQLVLLYWKIKKVFSFWYFIAQWVLYFLGRKNLVELLVSILKWQYFSLLIQLNSALS